MIHYPLDIFININIAIFMFMNIGKTYATYFSFSLSSVALIQIDTMEFFMLHFSGSLIYHSLDSYIYIYLYLES